MSPYIATFRSRILVRSMKRLLIALAFTAPLCVASDDEKLWTAPEPITFEGLHAWYAAGGLPDQRRPRERRLDLNGRWQARGILGIEGYSRGMIFAASRFGEKWPGEAY